ncbi:MAG: histidine kinase dimerization/phosphoacceptor domain -containing protein [Elstera sp.]
MTQHALAVFPADDLPVAISSAPENDGSIRVLYLDTNVSLGLRVKQALEEQGLTVTPVATSQEAFTLLGKQEFDVIAVEHAMPPETGLDVLARLGPRHERSPVIYVTGSADARLVLQALRSGADEYVIKDSSPEFYELLMTAIGNVIERWRLKSQKAEDEQAVRDARDRAELLLDEVNHRVANSLGLVVAMVRLQAAAVSDPAAVAALQETQSRISAIAGVHRRLYTSDHIGHVEISDYLEHLVQELQASLADDEHPCTIRLTAERLMVATDKAISVGIVVGELVTNAFKYAYGVGEGGDIRISVARTESETICLTVEDDGRGFDPLSPSLGTGLGTKILAAMASSLKADIRYMEHKLGTRVRLEFSQE